MSKCPEQVSENAKITHLQCPKHFSEPGKVVFYVLTQVLSKKKKFFFQLFSGHTDSIWSIWNFGPQNRAQKSRISKIEKNRKIQNIRNHLKIQNWYFFNHMKSKRSDHTRHHGNSWQRIWPPTIFLSTSLVPKNDFYEKSSESFWIFVFLFNFLISKINQKNNLISGTRN